MICCDDPFLKADALKCFNEFSKRIIHISICHFSDISYGYDLKVNPYDVIDAICAVLSNEKKNISDFGVKATELILSESYNILGDNVCILNLFMVLNLFILILITMYFCFRWFIFL